jgi:DNA polymerase elongation subunit (family B)
MATSQIIDVLGTIKVAEMSIINFCHHILHKQVPDSILAEESDVKFDGATVLDPKTGMHEQIASLDLTSLYPSTIRSLNISPETLVGSFKEKGKAFTAIRNNATTKLTFVNENNGKEVIAPANQWKRIFKNQNQIVSAAGVVFHQKYDGVIPSILTTWFAERKEYKAKMNEASKKIEKILEKYKEKQ